MHARAPIPRAMPPLLIPILALVLSLLGLGLLISGLRGRILNAKPHCRRCAFDLTAAPGIAELLSLESPPPARCPECGTTLTTGAHLRLGRRQRRPARIFFASILLVVTLPGVVLPVISTLLAPSTLTKLPDSLLELQALYAPANARLPAIDELLKRLEKGGWSTTGLGRVADTILERSNATGEIPPALAPLIQKAFEVSATSPEVTSAWFAKRFTLAVTTNSKVRQGQKIPFRLRATPTLASRSDSFWTNATLRLEQATLIAVDEHAVEHDCGAIFQSAKVNLSSQGHAHAEYFSIASLPPGNYTLRATFPYWIEHTSRRNNPPAPQTLNQTPAPDPAPTTHGSYHLAADCTVLPPDTPVVALNSDPEVVRAMREALTRAKVVAVKRGSSSAQFPVQAMLFLKSEGPLPGSGYYKVTIEALDPAPPSNWTARTPQNLYLRAGRQPPHSAVSVSFAPGLEPKSVRVTLTPNPQDAELHSDALTLTEIIDGVITLDCVPVEWRTESHFYQSDPGNF